MLTHVLQIALGNNKDRIHIIVSCKTLDEFDNDTKNYAGGVHIWADIGGTVATQYVAAAA